MLELSKNMYSLDTEYNELLGKVTSFTKYVPGCGESGRIMIRYAMRLTKSQALKKCLL